MNTATIGTVSAVQTAAVGPAASQGLETLNGVSFADLLMGLQQQGAASIGQSSQGNTGFSWREMLSFGQSMQGLQNLTALGDVQQNQGGLDELIANIMNLLAEAKNAPNGGEQTDKDLLLLVAKLQEELKTMQAANGQMMAGQQLLVLLAQFTAQPLTPVLTADGNMQLNLDDSQSALQALMLASPEEALQMLKGEGSQTVAGLLAALQPKAVAEESFTQTLGQQVAASQPQSTEKPSTVPAETPQGQEAAQNTTGALQTDAAMSTKIPLVAEESTAQPGAKPQEKNPAEALDVESLQQQVNSAQPLRTPIVTTGNAAPALPAPLANQMAEGIQTGLQTGAQEFSIKLMPEGLGEVTVKLKHANDGLQLTLVAKSAETQRMLAAEIDQLRDSLRPLRIEVQQVLTSRQEEMLNFQQNFQNQHQRQWQEMHGARYYGDRPLGQGEGTEEAEEAAQQSAAQPVLNVLDTYI